LSKYWKRPESRHAIVFHLVVCSTIEPQRFFKMTSSNFRRGSKNRTPKPRMTPSDLAEQFRELQRLRKKVYELEKRFAGEMRQVRSDDQTDPAGKRK
jgi:hypothetical protein